MILCGVPGNINWRFASKTFCNDSVYASFWYLCDPYLVLLLYFLSLFISRNCSPFVFSLNIFLPFISFFSSSVLINYVYFFLLFVRFSPSSLLPAPSLVLGTQIDC
ncbi:hypothetical protein ATANTOWER_015247 [Ataeniobius toweri]|uniref:Uncharacterized protein n=1 Tax=Ataeniobius toweri TaxID=208326 RepID=A0ABU7AY10_9TELE|nr:hypothetical protein [Ataeniobius toweri]